MVKQIYPTSPDLQEEEGRTHIENIPRWQNKFYERYEKEKGEKEE